MARHEKFWIAYGILGGLSLCINLRKAQLGIPVFNGFDTQCQQPNAAVVAAETIVFWPFAMLVPYTNLGPSYCV